MKYFMTKIKTSEMYIFIQNNQKKRNFCFVYYVLSKKTLKEDFFATISKCTIKRKLHFHDLHFSEFFKKILRIVIIAAQTHTSQHHNHFEKLVYFLSQLQGFINYIKIKH